MHIDLVMGQKFLPCMFANNVTGILSSFFHTVLRVFLIMESVLGSQFWMGWMHRFLCRSDTEFKYTLLSAYYCFFKHLNKG